MVMGFFLLALLGLLILASFAVTGYVLAEQNYKLLWLVIPYTALVLVLSFGVKQLMGWPDWAMAIIDVAGFALYGVVLVSMAVHYVNVWKTKRKLNKA